MKRALVLARIEMVEAFRSRQIPIFCSLVLVPLAFFVGLRLHDGTLTRDPESAISSLGFMAAALGIWVGFLMAWGHAGGWYERGCRSGSLVFQALRPLPRGTVVVGSWLGAWAVSATPILTGSLAVAVMAICYGVGPAFSWVLAVGSLPCLAFWAAAFIVGPLFISRGTTAGILLLLIFGAGAASGIVRTLGPVAGKTLLYLQPPLLPAVLISDQGKLLPDLGEPLATMLYQACGATLLLLAGTRRLDGMEIADRN